MFLFFPGDCLLIQKLGLPQLPRFRQAETNHVEALAEARVIHTALVVPVLCGLTVRCQLDTGRYPSGVVVSDAEMAALNVKRAEFHGEWNYTISPNTRGTPDSALRWCSAGSIGYVPNGRRGQLCRMDPGWSAPARRLLGEREDKLARDVRRDRV